MYEMTKDGCAILAFGFTGPQATRQLGCPKEFTALNFVLHEIIDNSGTSRMVAKVFNKQHKNVMRAIRNLEYATELAGKPEFARLNCQLHEIIDNSGPGWMVAEVFNKQHKDVLRAIQTLECPGDFTERNFAPTSYTDKFNRKKPMYELTKDGCAILAFGFSNQAAASIGTIVGSGTSPPLAHSRRMERIRLDGR